MGSDKSNSSSDKSGMDRINESMNKIGAMLGVQPSSSNMGTSAHNDKKEHLITEEDKKQQDQSVVGKSRSSASASTEESYSRRMLSMNSAENMVLGPPRVKTAGAPAANDTVASSQGTRATHGTGATTRPTVPGRTKTEVGAAIASLAATVDNTVNVVNKSFRKITDTVTEVVSEHMDNVKCDPDAAKAAAAASMAACSDTFGDPEKGSNSGHEAHGKVSADGTTVTEYVSIEKPRQRPKTPQWVYVTTVGALALLVMLAVTAAIPGSFLNNWFSMVNDDVAASQDQNVSIAFIGNSYLYVNDVPRVMESISKGRISQQSVINTGAGLGSLLKQGSGMYQLWQTPNAMEFWETFDFKETMMQAGIEIDDDYELYDYGYCTVPQLLDGFDNSLSYRNQNGRYFDVGTNPCFEDEYYLMIMKEKNYNNPEYFDYVVLNDQTRRMANEDGREDSMEALIQAYAALIKQSRAIPILVDTHAFGYDFTDLFEELYADEEQELQDNYWEQQCNCQDECECEEGDEDCECECDCMQEGEEEGEEEQDSQEEEEAEGYYAEGQYYEEDADYADYFEDMERYYELYGNNTNMTWDFDEMMEEEEEVDEIAQFTAQIYEGLYEYRKALKYNLPSKQHPRIAKIGLTYLAIYEDNIRMYAKLFAEDGIHASQHGTYLFACVLYCTIYGHLPLSPHNDFDVRSVFFKSRALYGEHKYAPSLSEANYLRKWARKVQVDGYVPKKMVFPEEPVDPAYAEEYWWNVTGPNCTKRCECEEGEEDCQCDEQYYYGDEEEEGASRDCEEVDMEEDEYDQ